MEKRTSVTVTNKSDIKPVAFSWGTVPAGSSNTWSDKKALTDVQMTVLENAKTNGLVSYVVVKDTPVEASKPAPVKETNLTPDPVASDPKPAENPPVGTEEDADKSLDEMNLEELQDTYRAVFGQDPGRKKEKRLIKDLRDADNS